MDLDWDAMVIAPESIIVEKIHADNGVAYDKDGGIVPVTRVVVRGHRNGDSSEVTVELLVPDHLLQSGLS